MLMFKFVQPEHKACDSTWPLFHRLLYSARVAGMMSFSQLVDPCLPRPSMPAIFRLANACSLT